MDSEASDGIDGEICSKFTVQFGAYQKVIEYSLKQKEKSVDFESRNKEIKKVIGWHVGTMIRKRELKSIHQ